MRARPVITAAVAIGVVYGAVCALAWAFQDRLVWFPGPPPTTTPGAYGLEFQDVRFTAADGVTLHGWFIPSPSGQAVLVSHGNGGTVENVIPLARAFHEMGHAVVLYDYRGYGNSAGTPSEDGTYRDAEAAFDWLRAQGFAPRDITAFGHSLGGAVSIALATTRPVGRVVVENTFSSLADIGAHAYPWLPVRLLSRIQYDNVARAGGITVPVLVIHSAQDELIPIRLGRRLFDALPGPKQFLETRGGHNDGGFMMDAVSRAAVRDFLARNG